MTKKKEELQANTRLIGDVKALQGGRRTMPKATAEEAAERKAERRTQGKKGVKLNRVAASFTPEALEYIKVMSKIRGESMSEFIERVLMQHKAENMAQFEAAKQIIDNT